MTGGRQKFNLAAWSDVSQHLSRRHNLWALFAGAATGLLVVGAVLLAVGPLSSQSKEKAYAAATPDDAYSTAYDGHYDKAQGGLTAAADKAKTDKDKVEIFMTQATLAYNAKKYDDAKEFALKAEQAMPTDATAALLGDILLVQGDKAAARTYYESALERLDKNTQSYPGRLHSYQAKLEAAKS